MVGQLSNVSELLNVKRFGRRGRSDSGEIGDSDLRTDDIDNENHR